MNIGSIQGVVIAGLELGGPSAVLASGLTQYSHIGGGHRNSCITPSLGLGGLEQREKVH